MKNHDIVLWRDEGEVRSICLYLFSYSASDIESIVYELQEQLQCEVNYENELKIDSKFIYLFNVLGCTENLNWIQLKSNEEKLSQDDLYILKKVEQYLILKEKKRVLVDVPIWDRMLKEFLFEEFYEIKDKKILDFGCGEGYLAGFLSQSNQVVAMDPNIEKLKGTYDSRNLKFIQGDESILETLDEKFDLIICHNVLEYVANQKKTVQCLAKHLKKDGRISIIKHNRPGRVMQMAVLLNNFGHANELLDGKNSNAQQFGTIQYYEDESLIHWVDSLSIARTRGFRAFYDLQQNQTCHSEENWQKQMLNLEKRVMEIEPYRSISFFHILDLEFKDQ